MGQNPRPSITVTLCLQVVYQCSLKAWHSWMSEVVTFCWTTSSVTKPEQLHQLRTTAVSEGGLHDLLLKTEKKANGVKWCGSVWSLRWFNVWGFYWEGMRSLSGITEVIDATGLREKRVSFMRKGSGPSEWVGLGRGHGLSCQGDRKEMMLCFFPVDHSGDAALAQPYYIYMPT